MKPIYLAIRRLIDSVWTLEFTITDNSIEIVSYSRDNSLGYKHEKTLPRCRLLYDEDRIVWGAFVGNQKYVVSNPKFLFDYGEPKNEQN